MTAKSWLVNGVRRLVGVHHIMQSVKDSSNDLIRRLKKAEGEPDDADDDEYIIRLEYPPSYDYRPRWGYSRPPHEGLSRMFAREQAAYDETLRRLTAFKPQFDQIPPQFSRERPTEPGWMGGPINAIDAAMLYYFVATLRPRTYLEIGSGVTTTFAARAKMDHRLATKIVSIDPYPAVAMQPICDVVIPSALETVDLKMFDELEAGDVVFMDGSHRAFMNSDVTVFMLDVLPRLQPGVVVHFHDIALPMDYDPRFQKRYWNEQYILAAYLLGARHRVKVLMPTGYVARQPGAQEILRPLLRDWKGSQEVWTNGGSMWFTHA